MPAKYLLKKKAQSNVDCKYKLLFFFQVNWNTKKCIVGETKHYKIGICCFSTEHVALVLRLARSIKEKE
jgi:hypothetical protein